MDFLQIHMKKIGEEKVDIITHGGEPLLAFEKIVYLVNELKKKNINYSLWITTNATLLNPEKQRFLLENYDHISISIDGKKTTNDLNRIYPNHRSCYEVIVPIIKEMLKHNPDISGRMTFTPDTVPFLYDNIRHLHELGFYNIIPEGDFVSQDWNEKDFVILEEQLKKVVLWVKNHGVEANISILDEASNKLMNGMCDGGISSLSISSDGSIYPCTFTVGHKEEIVGDVYTGIDYEKVNRISSIGKTPIQECLGCARYDYCIATRCRLINKYTTGDALCPSMTQCNLENVKCAISRFYRKNMI